MASKTRKFNRKIFKFDKLFEGKYNANIRANKLRSTGHHARITHEKISGEKHKMYLVWYRMAY